MCNEALGPPPTAGCTAALWRPLLRTLSGWRYKLRLYQWPVELRLLLHLMRYQRPETAGF